MNKVDRLEKLTEQLIETYKAKNNDYGDSFADSYREFGITSAVVRMNDKMNRIKSLSKGEERQVKDESLRDSLMDLANYALMTVIEIENEQERGPKGEPFKFNRENIMMDFGSGYEAVGRIGEIKLNPDDIVCPDPDDIVCPDPDDIVFPERGNLDPEEVIQVGGIFVKRKNTIGFKRWKSIEKARKLEEGKIYLLNVMLSGVNCDSVCLNLNLRDKICFLSNDVSTEIFQTEFTKRNILKLIEDYDIDLDNFDIVEVEE